MKKIKNHKHFYTALAIGSKIINSFFILKILSIILSNQEFVDYMLFLNGSSIFQFIFTLGLTTGIVAQAKIKKIFSDLSLIIYISVFTLILSILINEFFSFIDRIIIITSLFISLKIISFSVLNGINRRKEFTIICSIDSLLLILATFAFHYLQIHNGYIYAYLISSAIVFLIFLILYRKQIYKAIIKTTKNTKNKFVIFLLRYKTYFFMSLFSAFVVPSINYYIRNIISKSELSEFSIASLLAAWRFNESLLMVVGTFSTIYFIQKFKVILNKPTLRTTIINNAVLFSLLTYSLPLLTITFPNLIITIILSKQYVESYMIFALMFVSFSLRSYAYILGLYLVIYKKASAFILIETTHTLFLIIYIKFAINYSALVLSFGFILQSLIACFITQYFVKRED
ncbi:hypothetical protein AB7092_17650 [Providencia rettgeri]|uniref:hypothetical protein n=1 Tax=Providencia sp. PROV158 TaxID=2949868 RepID=UPI00234AEC8A|nr:hypothetical protein [Providencia sp. PROV158]